MMRMFVPLVLGPELAIAKIPAPVNRSSESNSSSLEQGMSVNEYDHANHPLTTGAHIC